MWLLEFDFRQFHGPVAFAARLGYFQLRLGRPRIMPPKLHRARKHGIMRLSVLQMQESRLPNQRLLGVPLPARFSDTLEEVFAAIENLDFGHHTA